MAKKEGLDISDIPSTPTRETDLPSHGSCPLPKENRCAHGWHWRPIKPNGTCFVYDEEDPHTGMLDPLSYSGKMVAFERCPAYCEAAGWVIDPKDNRRLWISTGKENKSRSRKAIAE